MTPKKRSTEPPQHRADLAGSLAARTVGRRYLEIIFGLGLGLMMWVIDAAMHARLAGATLSSGKFLDELLWPGITPVLFRGAYVAIAIAFGCALWRLNLKREATERQERDRALTFERVRTMLAIVNTFRHEVNKPLAVIADNAELLPTRPRSANDYEKLDQISQSAVRISSFIKQIANSAPLYLVDVAGVERIAPHHTFGDPDEGNGANGQSDQTGKKEK